MTAPADYKFVEFMKVGVLSSKELPVGIPLELKLVPYNPSEPTFGWRVETWKALKNKS